MRTLLASALAAAALFYPVESSARDYLIVNCEAAGHEAQNIMSRRLSGMDKSQAIIPIVTTYQHARIPLSAADLAFVNRMIEEAYEVDLPPDYRSQVHTVEDFGTRVQAECENF